MKTTLPVALLWLLTIASGCRGQDYTQLRLWRRLAAPDRVTAVAFSPDGKLLAGGSRRSVTLWDSKGKVVGQLALRDADVDAQNKAAGTELDPLAIPVPALELWVNNLAFSPDSKILAVTATNSGISLWDVATGKLLHALAGNGSATLCIAFSPDGKTLASGGSDKLPKLWSVVDGKLLKALGEVDGHLYRVVSVAFSADGKLLTSLGVQNAGRDNCELKVWDITTGQMRDGKLFSNVDPGLAFLNAQATVMVSLQDADVFRRGWIVFWSTVSGAVVRRVYCSFGMSLVAVACSQDLSVVAGGSIYPRFSLDAGRGPANRLAPVGRFQAWEVRTGQGFPHPNPNPKQQEAMDYLETSPLTCLAFSSNAHAIAVGTEARTVEVWTAP